MLRGRQSESAVLATLLDGVRAGRSGVLVVHGEAGVGKTALLDDALESAGDVRVARAVGVESEIELAFAALHQLCGPMLDHLDKLPEPQRDALGTAFGLHDGPAPDRFLVGLAAAEPAGSQALSGESCDGRAVGSSSCVPSTLRDTGFCTHLLGKGPRP